MDTAVLMEIENLRRASLAALREKYREVFREETRVRHREHLFRRIAWRLQALAEGDLSRRRPRKPRPKPLLRRTHNFPGCTVRKGRAGSLGRLRTSRTVLSAPGIASVDA